MTEVVDVAVAVPETTVQIGNFVVVSLETVVSRTFTFKIVEAPNVDTENPTEIPQNSPLALALLNKTIGTTVTVQNALPPYKVTIIKIY